MLLSCAILNFVLFSQCTVYHEANKTSSCEEPFEYVYGTCHKLITTYMNWFEAAEECGTYGAYLARIDSKTQNFWVFDYFSSLGLLNYDTWIGLNDIGEEGSYQWIDGSGLATFTNWGSSDPNNWNYENCVVVDISSSEDVWLDISCSSNYYALCQQNRTLRDNEGNLIVPLISVTATDRW